MTTLSTMVRAMTKQKDWYVELDEQIIAGPFRTLREARRRAFDHAKAAGDTDPWGSLSLRDREYPGFYALLTDAEVYHIGLGGALYEQGETYAQALLQYDRASA